jgi:hypothetical protein
MEAAKPEMIVQVHRNCFERQQGKSENKAETVSTSKKRVSNILHEQLIKKKLCAGMGAAFADT